MAFFVVSLTRYVQPQWGTNSPSFTQELGPYSGFSLGLEADSWYRWEEAMGYLFLLWILGTANPWWGGRKGDDSPLISKAGSVGSLWEPVEEGCSHQ